MKNWLKIRASHRFSANNSVQKNINTPWRSVNWFFLKNPMVKCLYPVSKLKTFSFMLYIRFNGFVCTFNYMRFETVCLIVGSEKILKNQNIVCCGLQLLPYYFFSVYWCHNVINVFKWNSKPLVEVCTDRNNFVVPTFDTKVTEHLCSGWVFFSSDKFRLFNSFNFF